ncbi:MAG: hypothetical protein U0353_32520 [Sandaracinus sp.]
MCNESRRLVGLPALLLLAYALGSAAPAHAQEAADDETADEAPPPGPPPVTATELRNAQTAIARELGSENWVAADALLDPLEDRLIATEDWQRVAQLGCDRAVLHLRQPLAMTSDYLREVRQDAGNGLAAATDDNRRFECFRLVGLSFAHFAALPELAARERDMAIDSAILFLSRARAIRDSAALRQSYEALPAERRAEIEALVSALRAQPLGRAVGTQPDADTLAAALARAAYLQSPLRQGSCSVDPAVTPTREGALAIVCVLEVYPLRGLSSIHASERYLVEPTEGGVRAIGMLRDVDLRDGVQGLVYEVRAFQRLTASQHGFDGYLYAWREGFELGGERRLASFVTICDRSTGLCQRVEIGRESCAPGAGGRPACTEGWEADATVEGGQLVLSRTRRPRRGARRDPLPAELAPRQDLRRSIGANASREATPELVSDPPIGRHCRLIVSGRAAVARATPAQGGASAGAVPHGMAVVPVDRRIGWVRVLSPVEGWLAARDVSRTCE